MSKNDLQKVKAFYAKQNDCPSLKWTRDANKVQRAVCTREGNADAVGKTNDVGILQITPIYVKDVNRILGEDKYDLSCRTDTEKSLEMFEILQGHYNPSKSIDKAIKLHNPKASQSYRIKIMNKMEIIKSNLS